MYQQIRIGFYKYCRNRIYNILKLLEIHYSVMSFYYLGVSHFVINDKVFMKQLLIKFNLITTCKCELHPEVRCNNRLHTWLQNIPKTHGARQRRFKDDVGTLVLVESFVDICWKTSCTLITHTLAVRTPLDVVRHKESYTIVVSGNFAFFLTS